MADTLILPLSRKDFRNAKQGYIVKKMLFLNDEQICVLISNRTVRKYEMHDILLKGISIAPLDISDLSWSNIEKMHKRMNIVEYENLSIMLVSNELYNEMERYGNMEKTG